MPQSTHGLVNVAGVPSAHAYQAFADRLKGRAIFSRVHASTKRNVACTLVCQGPAAFERNSVEPRATKGSDGLEPILALVAKLSLSVDMSNRVVRAFLIKPVNMLEESPVAKVGKEKTVKWHQ